MALSLHAPKKLTGISHSAGPVAGPSATNPMLSFRFPADGTHIQHFALTVPGGQGSIQNRSLKIVTSTMLPWRVMNIERHWDVQENSVRMRVPDRYLGAGNSKRVFNRKTIFRGYLTTAGS